MDTVNRQITGRLFRGALQSEADSGPWGAVGAVFDKIDMPALVLEPGKNAFYEFELAQNTSVTLALPEEYSSSERLYIAVLCDLKGRLTYTSPTHGTGKIVLLQGTDDTTSGTHAAFWSYQGDMTSFAVSVPSTADGGATTRFSVFMYEIPDLTDVESYFDQQLAYGTEGDE